MSLEDRIHLPTADHPAGNSIVQEFLAMPERQLIDKARANLLPLVESRASPIGAQVVDVLNTAPVPLGAAPRNSWIEARVIEGLGKRVGESPVQIPVDLLFQLELQRPVG